MISDHAKRQGQDYQKLRENRQLALFRNTPPQAAGILYLARSPCRWGLCATPYGAAPDRRDMRLMTRRRPARFPEGGRPVRSGRPGWIWTPPGGDPHGARWKAQQLHRVQSKETRI